jgi:cell division protein FtsW (lipid II flippase)
MASLALGFLLLHAGFVVWGGPRDPVLLPTVAALMGLGLALVQRLAVGLEAPAYAGRHWLWLLLALATIGAVAHWPFDLGLLRRYRYSVLLAGLGLVAATLVAGHATAPGGPRLWLGLGGFSFQPSEVLKLLLVVFLAAYLADKQELLAATRTRLGPVSLPPVPYLAPLLILLGLSLGLLFVQRDLGAALLLFVIALGLLYVASGRLDVVAIGLGGFALGAWLLHERLAIVQTRAAIWLDPWAEPQGAGYQVIQALLAIGAGGVLGTGLGFGEPTAIPAVHTDFVYAALAEELGLAGATAVLGLVLVLVLRGFRIALEATDAFERLLAAGLSFAFAVQTFLIVGGVLKVIPLTGITLPFLSYGGTSLVTSAVAVGLLLRIGRGRG